MCGVSILIVKIYINILYMLQLHGLFFKSLTDKFVGVSDHQSECLRVTTFRVKRDTLADFKKNRYFEETSR